MLPVIQTPFDDGGRIDEGALRGELEWVLDQGVAGLTTGMVSEVLRLDHEERRRLNALVAGAARDRGALAVLSVGTEATLTTLDLARSAEEDGADAVMVIPPVTVSLGEAEIARHYLAIAEAISIGLVVQDASGYVGRPLSITLQARLFDELGSRVTFKPEAPPLGQRVSELRAATNGRARVLEGTAGAMLPDTFPRGVVGTMPGAEVCWAVQRLWEALAAGEGELVETLGGLLLSLVALQPSLDAFLAVEKYLLVLQGVLPSAAVRQPVGFALDEDSRREVERLGSRLAEVCGRRWPS